MIAALSKGAAALDEPRFLEAAKKAADFILANRTSTKGGLLHSFRQKGMPINGFLEDYAFMVWGLIELYETCFEVRYLKAAVDLSEYLVRHFMDELSGGFFQTSDEHEKLPTRLKELYDGALPSGNSVAAYNFLRLSRLTGSIESAGIAEKLYLAFGSQIRMQPSAYTQFLTALNFSIGPAFEIAIAGNPDDPHTKAMLKALRNEFIPNMTLHLVPPESPSKRELAELSPFINEMKGMSGKVSAYVCSGQICHPPVNDIPSLLSMLGIKPRD